MGNLSSASYQNALTLLATLLLCGGIILTQARALNAMSMGEEYALHVGVSVRRVKLTVMICVSAMIGMSVSVGGGIGFVGLVTPHMIRLIVGANHRRTLPACLYGGAIFLLLADLISRTILAPAVLPVGVVTSIIGAAAFLVIFLRTKRGSAHEPTAEHVSVLRGRTEIVHDVSFSVSDGQWLMICGPNGAGNPPC